MRSGGRVVEGARLESEYTAKPYRGFESLPLRHLPCAQTGRSGLSGLSRKRLFVYLGEERCLQALMTIILVWRSNFLGARMGVHAIAVAGKTSC